jgi:hypothetical protein
VKGANVAHIQSEPSRSGEVMSRVIELTYEQYDTISQAASGRGTTPEAVLAALIEALRDPLTQPRYYETDEWFHHLGMSDEDIAEITRQVEADGDADA